MQRSATNGDPAGVRWHIDRRIPVVLVFAILMQSAAAIWWASAITERVATLERIAEAREDQSDRLVVVETLLRDMRARLPDPQARSHAWP